MPLNVTRRSAIGTIVGGSAVLGSGVAMWTPARAVVPVMAILQLGALCLQLARSSSAGGPGIDSLLSTQAQMLREISTQIALLHDKIDLLLKNVDELKGSIEALPARTVDSWWDSEIRASCKQANELLTFYGRVYARRGRLAAIEAVQDDVLSCLRGLEKGRNVLIASGNPLSLPLLCCAWFAEAQLRYLVGNHNGREQIDRLRTAAGEYEKVFDAYLAKQGERSLSQAIKSAEDEAGIVMGFLASTDTRACYLESSFYDNDEKVFEGEEICGASRHGGDRYCRRYIHKLSVGARLQELAFVSESEEVSEAYRYEFAKVTELGAPVGPMWSTIGLRRLQLVGDSWRRTEIPPGPSTDYDTAKSVIRASMCPGPIDSPTRRIARGDELADKLDVLRTRGLAYAYVYLACAGAMRSVRSVLNPTR